MIQVSLVFSKKREKEQWLKSFLASWNGVQPKLDGWAWKEGGSVKSWKKRYFVLRGSSLLYYNDKPAPGDLVCQKNRVALISL